MRLIDRLNHYLSIHSISPAAFEKSCNISNGYIGNQTKGKGTVGSDTLEKIAVTYPDINLDWLITGKGKMRLTRRRSKVASPHEVKEDQAIYQARQKLIMLLKEQIKLLEK